MNYQESMAGLDQVFEALFAQQQRPVMSEVDEMQTQNAKGGMNDLMQQLKAIGQDQRFDSGYMIPDMKTGEYTVKPDEHGYGGYG